MSDDHDRADKLIRKIERMQGVIDRWTNFYSPRIAAAKDELGKCKIGHAEGPHNANSNHSGISNVGDGLREPEAGAE